MPKTGNKRMFLELCTILGCFVIVLISFTQVLVFTQSYHEPTSRMVTSLHVSRSVRSSAATKRLSMNKVSIDKRAVLDSNEGEKKEDENASRKADVKKIKENASQKSVTTKKVLSPAAQAKAARARAQAEVRELERMLAKLMRTNTMTPVQAQAKFRTDHYERRISQIIQHVSEHGVQPYTTNKTRLRKPHERARIQQALDQPRADLLNLRSYHKSHNTSVVDVFQRNKPVPLAILRNTNQTEDGEATLNILDLLKKRKSRTQMHTFKQLNKTEEEEMRDLATVQPPLEGNFFRDEIERFEDRKRSVFQGRELFMDEEALIAESGKNVCPRLPDTLVGSIGHLVNLTQPLTFDEVLANNSDVKEGGEWQPTDCVSRHRVAIIIPYRDRWAHLKVLLYHLVPMLKRQQIHFRIFVAEQHGNHTFNKGILMNAAFREAIKLFDPQCVTFHDVDLVPEDDRNIYSCSEQPKHMSLSIDKFSYVLPYEGLVGGVLTFQTAHFQLVNGYSNMYWGWGAEDDDMTIRIMHQGLRIYRPPANIARYKMVKHTQRKVLEVSIRMKLLRSAARRSKLEGLNNVNYKVVFIHTEKLFTHIMVDVGKQ